jgi:rubredoxin
MKKYVCIVCGYGYDPAAGDPDGVIAPVPLSKTSPTTGSVPSAAQPKISSSPKHDRNSA